MGAEVRQQGTEFRIQAAAVQRHGKEDPAVFQGPLQPGAHLGPAALQRGLQGPGKPLRGGLAGADDGQNL